WPNELRGFQFKHSPGALTQINSIKHYFAKAFEFSELFPDQNVLDFAIKRTMSIHIQSTAWHLYETYLLKAARASSMTLPSVIQIIVSYNYYKQDVNKPRISKLIHDLILKNAPLAHHSEVAWALFLAKALNIKISKSAAKQISLLENSVCALLALDLKQHSLVEGLNEQHWRKFMTKSGLLSHMWLLAYEADLKGWLSGKDPDFVDKDSYFSELKKKKISFYDTKRNVQDIRKRKPLPPSGILGKLLSG
ncbi:unnamed protein product, partial [Discosporangium mesarthrocarpum]